MAFFCVWEFQKHHKPQTFFGIVHVESFSPKKLRGGGFPPFDFFCRVFGVSLYDSMMSSKNHTFFNDLKPENLRQSQKQ
jgi:hypothetical protein